MLKGVNKQILEVTNTDSPYFEKIIFFVRSGSPTGDERKLRREAEKISSSTATKPPKSKPNKMQIVSIASISLLAALAGIALSFVLNYIGVN